MNARIILAAVAAICCVQGIAAASLDRQSWTETDLSEFADMDFDQAVKQVIAIVDQQEETGLDLKQSRGYKDTSACDTSIANLFKSLRQVKEVFYEFHTAYVVYKAAQTACTITTTGDDQTNCLAVAASVYARAYQAVKDKTPGTVIKAFKSVIALKSCRDIF